MSIRSESHPLRTWQSCGATHVAVYGTLRAGGVNDIVRLRPGIAPVGQTLLRGSLYDLGWYPGLRLQGHQQVLAEVYPIDEALEQALDGIEGLWPENLGEYVKQVISLPVTRADGKQTPMDLLVYEALPGTVANCPRIADEARPGQALDWLAWAAAQSRRPPHGVFTLRAALQAF